MAQHLCSTFAFLLNSTALLHQLKWWNTPIVDRLPTSYSTWGNSTTQQSTACVTCLHL
ncbi:hypothetical protein PF005_g12270 [Phytophthora fragariae]|uniref:RxLR effector protein n=2 Tax=Phytophthora TaxID=4783 RepID=A0A6A3E4J7_9STRA|nr:hypothetical protein PF003_g30549 [Phytophthora fragariae]KAE9025240.1 hypothetical protein PR002_g11243 [Phytophthora rubi]KAE8926701.1 hypothetical protein PF009_g23115 [Phytophthora fragariae]KAE8984027.1 hypothetical protein PF011_g20940 [Phytophthora fragariae]KAE9027649.1 hypothetical protein PR001_g11921 [Phytophthora rubi]